MSTPAAPLTNDPIALQAMLTAERVENERLRQIIKELQRHRFGRRAESLPLEDENAKLKKLLADQMLEASALRELLAKKW